MRRVLFSVLIIGLLLGVLFPSAAPAALIQFQATDLVDTSPGQDLWRYTYVVSGFSFPQNVAFETLFDPALYSNLQDPPPAVNADWDIISLQPDPSLPDAGRYSALALVDGASLADPFPLSFVWLGGPGTTPGAQPFEINAFDAQGDFIGTLETGQTTPAAQAVPLPGTFGLMVSGLLGVVLVRKAAARGDKQ